MQLILLLVPRETEPRKYKIRRQERNSKIEAGPSNVLDKRKLYHDAGIQVAPELSDDYTLADQGVQYTDATTQTDFTDVELLTPSKQDDIERRAPLIQIKSKTFPTCLKKCASDCNQPAPQIPGVQSPRKRYKHEAVQTELVETSQNASRVKTPESKRPSFKTSPQTSDLYRTFPFASPSPFQRSPVARSPHKSVDEVAVRRSRHRIEPLDTEMPAPQELSPSRPSPWSPRCTQCSAEIKATDLEPQLESPIEPETASRPDSDFEPNHELEVRPQLPAKWSHTCTARSSLECQQCARPEVSAPISQRDEPPETPSRSPERASRQSPARTTHWAANLEAELEEIIQGYHFPEERFMQRKVIQETIDKYTKQPPLADPVKKPTQSRIRLRPSPTARALPKQDRAKPNPPTPPAPVSFVNGLPQSETTSSTLTRDSSGISDRAVFRGLHVATAAACDEDVAKWIEEITGTGIRRFLADLSAFDGLGFNTLAGVAKRAAKQRRGEVLAWERVREKRLQERDLDDGLGDCAVEGEKGVCKGRKMGFVAGDETVNMRVERSARERSGEQVLDDMVAARECRSREGLRERAIRMGWRDRSVSGGE